MRRANQPIVIIGILFFVFGFVTWLGSVLIPYFKIACELSNFQSYLVAFAFYISYMVMAIPAGRVLTITGYKKGMSLGLLIMALGALTFIPAACLRSYPLFLTGLFIQGTGLAILQTASNPYITILGPIESAAKRISIMGICNGVAGIIAPMILGAVALKDADAITSQLPRLDAAAQALLLDQLARRVIVPYICMTAALIAVASLVYRSALPDLDHDDEPQDGKDTDPSRPAENIPERKNVLQYPHLVLGVIALFLYVGVEVIAGDTIIGYATSQGMPFSSAKFFSSLTLACMLGGYVIGIITIPKYISQVKVLRLSAMLGLLFGVLALCTTGFVSVLFIALLGLANSLVWPSIWPLAITGLGRFTKAGSSLLIMAIGGGALLPLLYGWLADKVGVRHAYWEVIPCYLFIFYYARSGYRQSRHQLK